MPEHPSVCIAVYPPASEGFPYIGAVILPTGEVKLKACPTHMDAVAFTEDAAKGVMLAGVEERKD